MEQRILAGKKEVLKVPEMIGKLRTAHKESKSLQYELADLTESNEELTSELEELQEEFTLVSIAKTVLEIDKAGYTKNLIEAREAVEELRNQMSTNDGGMSLYGNDDLTESLSEKVEEMEEDLRAAIVEEEETGEIDEELQAADDASPDIKVSTGDAQGDLQTTLDSIRSIIDATNFSQSPVALSFHLKKVVPLIDQAKGLAAESKELIQLLDELSEKTSSSHAMKDDILASLDQVQSKL
ncbi:MAG: hypothetical protein D8M57_15410 [Candidatus Scalindua sp. AMX11]|nr:MAG: hypothetical protein DWQ00_02240 [Candidatus Scalindua sp.]TDE64038.1 MAG: hypothetical protein D8M57_15410 [Candidatus Scalindua sp. AMX11]GJQ60908.1 MAG: hypothetical protein SCALA701_37090 [Candidatus Scalindua sp.]